IAGAAIDEWPDRYVILPGGGLDGTAAPLVYPIRVRAGASHPGKHLHVQHGHQRLSVWQYVSASPAPEITEFCGWGIFFWMSKMICADGNTHPLGADFIGHKAILKMIPLSRRSFRRLRPHKADALILYSGPIVAPSLIIGNVDSQNALCLPMKSREHC